MRSLAACSILFAALWCQVVVCADRPPVPDKAAMKVVEEVHRASFEKAKSPAEKRTVILRMLKQAEGEKDANQRLALLHTARDRAVEIGAAELAFRAIDAIAGVDGFPAGDRKADTLIEMGRQVNAPAECRLLLEQAEVIVQEAIADDRYDSAAKLAQAAVTAARRARNLECIRQAAALESRTAKAAQGYLRAKNAMEVLAKEPTDADANLTAGRFYCFVKGDWQKGLPMLTRGPAGGVREAATVELRPPSAVADELTLADAWWDLSLTASEEEKQQIAIHAASWYKSIVPSLSGLDKAKAEKRVAEVQRAAGSIPEAGQVAVATAEQLPIEVVRLQPKALRFEGIEKYPDLAGGAVQFDLPQGTRTAVQNGIVEFSVVRDTPVYLATFWGYDGNRSGGWYEERWTQEKLTEQGWKKLGQAPWASTKDWVLYRKDCKAGEKYSFRVNKYQPPRPIVPAPSN